MKTYLVTVKKIQETKMMVSENSGLKAIEKVNRVLTTGIENNINLDKTFSEKPFFRYKVKLLKKYN